MRQPTEEEKEIELKERELIEHYALRISHVLHNIYNLKEQQTEEFGEDIRKEYVDLVNLFTFGDKEIKEFYEINYKEKEVN